MLLLLFLNCWSAVSVSLKFFKSVWFWSNQVETCFVPVLTPSLFIVQMDSLIAWTQIAAFKSPARVRPTVVAPLTPPQWRAKARPQSCSPCPGASLSVSAFWLVPAAVMWFLGITPSTAGEWLRASLTAPSWFDSRCLFTVSLAADSAAPAFVQLTPECPSVWHRFVFGVKVTRLFTALWLPWPLCYLSVLCLFHNDKQEEASAQSQTNNRAVLLAFRNHTHISMLHRHVCTFPVIQSSSNALTFEQKPLWFQQRSLAGFKQGSLCASYHCMKNGLEAFTWFLLCDVQLDFHFEFQVFLVAAFESLVFPQLFKIGSLFKPLSLAPSPLLWTFVLLLGSTMYFSVSLPQQIS